MSEWTNYPMGPQLRFMLGIHSVSNVGDNVGDKLPAPTDDEQRRFEAYLQKELLQKCPIPKAELIDLLEELTTMKLAETVLALVQTHGFEPLCDDFRGLLSIGSCMMLEAEYDDAISVFKRAVALNPDELAPYINLAKIYLHLRQLDEAKVWAEAGLSLEPNFQGLWEILATALSGDSGDFASSSTAAHFTDTLKQRAIALNSHAGLSLAAYLEDAEDHLLRAQLLETHYQRGGREPEFLVEYTAALGMANNPSKIPQILWEAENLSKVTIPWQLLLHVVQAYLAMNQESNALLPLKKLLAHKDTPQEIREQCVTMMSGIESQTMT